MMLRKTMVLTSASLLVVFAASSGPAGAVAADGSGGRSLEGSFKGALPGGEGVRSLADRVLVRNERHLITARYSANAVTFVLEAIADRTDDRTGQFPAVDFVGLYVDVNQNARVDERVDVKFGVQRGGAGLCSQYFITATSSTACGGFRSGATLSSSFGATETMPRPHPTWEITIPKSELASNGEAANVAFTFHAAGEGYSHYPERRRTADIFGNVMLVSLSEAAVSQAVIARLPKATQILTPKVDQPNRVLEAARVTDAVRIDAGRVDAGRVADAAPVRPAPREVARDDRNLVTVLPSSDRVTFTLEALGDLSNNLAGEYPGKDFAGIRVDVNGNGRVDSRVDVAYGIAGGTTNRICTQYLLSETSSTGCGGLPSQARLNIGFRATAAGTAAHPVWQFSIPRSELVSAGRTAHLTFWFHSAGDGYSSFPAGPSGQRPMSFTETVQLDLNTLQARVPGGGGEVEEETDVVIVTSDTQAPLVTITSPPNALLGRVETSDGDVRISGKAEDESGLYQIEVNGEQPAVGADGSSFEIDVRLRYGENPISIRAVDLKDNEAVTEFVVVRADSQSRGVEPAGPGTAGELAAVGTYRALLIAVEDYDDNDLDLRYPIEHAERLQQVLTEHYTFEPDNVTLLRNPDRDAVIRELVDLANDAGQDDNVLIFYAGHGSFDWGQGEMGYWWPADAEKDYPTRWLSNSDVLTRIDAIGSRHVLLISDACFSGGILEGSRNALEGAGAAITTLYSRASRKGMTSGTVEEEVPDKSVFMDTLTARLETSPEGWLSADQLFASIRQPVMNATAGYTEPTYGRLLIEGDEDGEFIFIRRPE
jgi:hypothetical protein